MRWDDYYPSLGDKTIVIRSLDETPEIEGRIVKAEITYLQPDGEATITAQAAQTSIAQIKLDDGYYRAKFKLSGQRLTPSVPFSRDTDNIRIKFTLISKDGKKDESTIEEKWYIKNNSNTLLSDVLTGAAVFTYDQDQDNYGNTDHKGVTENETEKKFDFVQELLNQVIPRKRSVKSYSYIDEDGIFYSGTETAIVKFKDHFNVDNTKANTNNSFNKLIKDYNHEAVRAYWSNKIVDKETLVGSQFTTTERVVNQNDSGDTGLYELYENGVKVFVDAMLTEAERYITAPTQNWVARTGETATGTDTHGPGMSYCFGCKDSIEQFNDTVVNCQAETVGQIIDRENDIVDPIAIKYRGNVGSLNNTSCHVGGVANRMGQWAGLKDDEWDNWHGNVTNNAPAAFNPVNWAGIDCSGFVQRAIVAADSQLDDINTPVQPIQPTPGLELIGSSGFFDSNYVYYQLRATISDNARIEQQKKLRKGDLIRYNSHISIVYSEKAKDDGSYRIIHAFGTPYFDHDNDRSTDRIFSRKVIDTRHDIKLPRGYGRIRIWD